MFDAVDRFTTSRRFHPLRLRLPDFGLCYGVATALAWRLLERARLRRATAVTVGTSRT